MTTPNANAEIDLDALERQITDPRAHALTMMDGQAILGLIQRVREAETLWDRLRDLEQSWKDVIRQRDRAEARLAEMGEGEGYDT